ncbi:MAG: glycerol-3-phosphate 1-O-acyltransferase PlsB [Nevskiaceae bacterium]|nr:MAG: glycerol-3-phosphate 1-O-acyltransferase PlsB [Nevskiaceae bacterium]
MSGPLTSIFYWLAWLLFRPLDRLIQYRLTRADLRAELKLDPTKPVVFILATRSWTDLFVLDRICKELVLPRPSRTGLNFPTPEHAGVLYLPAVLEMRLRPTELTRLVETAIATQSYDAQLVPVSLFWGRDPGKETSLFKLAFFDSPQASAIRKLFIILANGRNVFANFGLPLSFREYVDKEKDAHLAVRKLTRVMHFHFLRARTAALGPTLLRRGVVIDGLLQSKIVQRAIDSRSDEKKYTREQSLRYARKCAEEICADYSTTSLTFLERFLGTFVWHRVFRGIDVQGLEKMRELAQSHEIIYMPSHRSHADYLLVSYSLYHAGLVPPHIAAGINLNMPLVGPLLRRCGAFFMRRSFSGDRIYTAVFRAYVDSLITRGYPIEFFPEGGRSRTGRLLAPKTGLLSMVAEAALKQRTRKVALVPVFIGYDKAWELKSYSKELRGGAKQKESVQGLLKASKILTKSYGKAYINFGEPIALHDYADLHLPGWREAFTPDAEATPDSFKGFISQLALEHMRRINAAAVANPVSVAAVALLSSPQRAVSEEELVEQIGHLIWLLKGQHYSDLQYIPETAPRAVVEWSAPIGGIRRVAHPWGDLLALADRDAVLLTYNRNNIQHLFALPSLVANFFRTRGMLPEEAVVMGCRALYPFLRTEFFLRWDSQECENATRECIEVMVKLGLLTRTLGGDLRRPDVTNPAFSTLAMLGRVMSETLERYCMTTLLLAEERKSQQALQRDRFEQDCQLLAERMAILTGRDAPEFFDKALFRGHLNTLIEVGLVIETDARTLAVDAKIERIAERSMELLSDEARQTLLQLLSRRRSPAATATGTSV